jgi:outer membrane protein assembly factor BamB
MRARSLVAMSAALALAPLLARCGGDDVAGVDPGDATIPGSDDGGDATGSTSDAETGPPPLRVTQHHLHANRDGLYVDPALTTAAAAHMVLDATFDGTVDGHVYAQPLYMEDGPGGRPAFFVVTENDHVVALDETTGKPIWDVTAGNAAAATGAGCGNIAPLGITGTPIIDPDRRTIYFDAVDATTVAGSIRTHLVHALSIDDGKERPGWPADAAKATNGSNTLLPVYQNERGALALLGGIVHVPYGGHAGDCGPYRGWVVGVAEDDPTKMTAYATGTAMAGIWAPGGLTSDGQALFVSTGNGSGGSWAGNEAVLRLGPGATYSAQPADTFAPTNWVQLDQVDLDLSGTAPLPIDVPGATPSALVLALGKDGNAYLLDRNNLGGVGSTPIVLSQVAVGAIIGAPAVVPVGADRYVVFRGHQNVKGADCPSGTSGDLVALRVAATSPPTLKTAWCAQIGGIGSPMVTTVNGVDQPIVWNVDAEATNELHAIDAKTGAILSTTTDPVQLVRRFTTPIAVHGRVLVGGDGRLYAFKPAP